MNLLQDLIRSKLIPSGDSPSPGPSPTGTIEITENGTYDVTQYAEADVAVPRGREVVLLASGSYTLAAQTSAMTIPVQYTGRVLFVQIEAAELLPDTAQSVAWSDSYSVPSPTGYKGFMSYGVVRARLATNQYVTSQSAGFVKLNPASLQANQASSNYPIRANTYNWYIWGYEE